MKKDISMFIQPMIGPLILLLLWSYGAKVIDNPLILPEIGSVIEHFSHPFEDMIGLGSLVINIFISILRVLLGYIIALVIALPLGIVMGYNKTVNKIINPVLGLFRPIPPLAWTPLVLAWFGVTSLGTMSGLDRGQLYIFLNNFKVTMMFIIFLGAFFPIITSTIHGISQVPKTLIESAKVLGASERDIFFKILLPGAAPAILNGMRIGLGSAWTSLVSAEMMPGSLSGVGYLITHAYELAKIDIVVVGMISIGIVGFFLDYSLRVVEKRKYAWSSNQEAVN